MELVAGRAKGGDRWPESKARERDRQRNVEASKLLGGAISRRNQRQLVSGRRIGWTGNNCSTQTHTGAVQLVLPNDTVSCRQNDDRLGVNDMREQRLV